MTLADTARAIAAYARHLEGAAITGRPAGHTLRRLQREIWRARYLYRREQLRSLWRALRQVRRYVR